ncbi:MAG: hypothetical protein ACT4NY_27025 [Pseudonocardiales bacterium]
MSAPGGRGVLVQWWALRRVHDGGVILVDGDYVQHGRVVIGEVADAITRLIDTGYLALGTPDPRGHRTVCVTVTGQTHCAGLQHHGGRQLPKPAGPDQRSTFGPTEGN